MEYIAEKLTLYLECKSIIHNERAIYKYGFEGLISTLTGTLILFIIGIISNHFVEAILYECVFSILRKYIGGYHCKSHITCIVSYNSLFIEYIIFKKYLNLNIFVILGCMIFICIYAPIKNKNKTVLLTSQIKSKRLSILWSFIIVICILGMYFYQIQYYKILFFVFVLTTIFMLGGQWEYEKTIL